MLLRRVSSAVAASDPGLYRLRTASTTLATVVVTAVVVVGLALLAGQPVTTALPSVIVAMISSFTVNDPTTPQRLVTTVAVVASAAAVATVSAALGPYAVAGNVVFVVIAVAAVFAQRLGPRGLAAGMVGFIVYFLVTFLGGPLGQVPFIVVAVALGAGMSLGMRTLLRQRHPERELRRLLSAMRVRAAAALSTLAGAVRAATREERPVRRLRTRLSRLRHTTDTVQDRLDGADDDLLDSISNRALSLRVYDFQLSVEHLHAAMASTVHELASPARDELVRHLDALAEALADENATDPSRWTRLAAELEDLRATEGTADERLVRLRHTIGRTVDSWRRPAGPDDHDSDADDSDADDSEQHRADSEDGSARDDEDDTDTDESASTPWSDTVRRAVQVGVATAAAIAVGDVLSPTRWFWTVIAAFVVFIGTSSRGEVLSKGWQRVLGTLGGVFAGVVVASLVGGDTVLAAVLIGVCLFLGLYLMSVSSGLMMFFITVLLALVYALLGRFSISLLLLRLEETAAGAAIGVAAAYFLLPTRTRTTIATAAATFLEGVRDVADDAATTLAEPLGADTAGPAASGPPAPARALQRSYRALRTTAAPLTDGLAGIVGRSGYRRTLRAAATCDHHARALARLAHHHPSRAAGPSVAQALRVAADGVVAKTAGLAEALRHPSRSDDGDAATRDDPATSDDPAATASADDDAEVASTDDALAALDTAARGAGDQPDPGSGDSTHPAPDDPAVDAVTLAAASHLRALDRAVEDLIAGSRHADSLVPATR